MPNLGPMEILVIFVVALVVLGPNRLPEAGRQVGKAFAEIRRWSSGFQAEMRDAFEVVEEPQPPDVRPVTAAPEATDAATDAATEAEPPAPTPGDLAPDERRD